jgi:hypothetical protein
MRWTGLIFGLTLGLSACATAPPGAPLKASKLAAMDGASPGMIAAAQAVQSETRDRTQLVDIRNAQARLDLARARLDYATVRRRGADDGDVREFLQARQDLRRLRNVYGPTDTGYRDQFSNPFFPYGGRWLRSTSDRLSYKPLSDGSGLSPAIETLSPGAAMPLSSLRR